MPESVPISACIICKNAERFIALALDSVAWCDEIVVVDSGSTDRTLEICRKHGSGKVRVVAKEWEGFNPQRRYAVEQCRNEWVLMLDSDEECSPELRWELERLRAADLQKAGLFEIPRKNYMAGRHILCWGPDFQTRFGHRERIEWDPAPIPEHRTAKTGFALRRTRAALLHNRLTPYSRIDLCDGRRMQEYGLTLADTLKERGKRGSLFNLLVRPLSTFIKYYFFKGGILQGRFGLVTAYKMTIYVMLKYSVLYGDQELERK